MGKLSNKDDHRDTIQAREYKMGTDPGPLNSFWEFKKRELSHIIYIILMLHTGKICINLQQSALMYIQQNHVTKIWNDVFEISRGASNTGYSCWT